MIKGFTTNPSLMHKAGVTDYEAFARRLLSAVPDRPISFEVFADEPREILRHARVIASWGPNVNGRDLDAYSAETVETLHRDANAAGFIIATSSAAAE
jgi:transaldolase